MIAVVAVLVAFVVGFAVGAYAALWWVADALDL